MTLDELLTSRRSIRKYQDKQVPDGCISSMVKAALTAPSPSNSQPVRFIRIRSEQIRLELTAEMEAGFERLVKQAETKERPRKLINVINYYWRYSSFLTKVPELFAIGAEKTESGFGSRLHKAGLLTDTDIHTGGVDISIGFSLAAAILKGQELGLGSCILTAPLIFLNDLSFLTPGPNLELKCFLTTGFPAEEPEPVNKHGIEEVLSHV